MASLLNLGDNLFKDNPIAKFINQAGSRITSFASPVNRRAMGQNIQATLNKPQPFGRAGEKFINFSNTLTKAPVSGHLFQFGRGAAQGGNYGLTPSPGGQQRLSPSQQFAYGAGYTANLLNPQNVLNKALGGVGRVAQARTTTLLPKTAPRLLKAALPAIGREGAQSLTFGGISQGLSGKTGDIKQDFAKGLLMAGALNKLSGLSKTPSKSNFSIDRRTFDELIEAEEILRNPKSFIGKINTGAKTEKEAIQKIIAYGVETVERISAKHLPNKQLTTLKTPQAKIKALVDLSSQNRLANVPGMGLLGGEQAIGYKDSTQFSSMLDQKPRFEIDDSRARLLPIKKNGFLESPASEPGEYKLSDILDHKQLFEQYPKLSELKVKVVGDGNALEGVKTAGSYNSKTNTLTMQARRLGDDQPFQSTLLHEIQHAIQEIEGFARGGSPEQVIKSAEDSQTLINFMRDPSPTNKQALENTRSYRDLLQKYSPMEVYARLSGELEARAVQRRMDLPQQSAYPNKLYHGTPAKFEDFDLNMAGKSDNGFAGKGIYFATDPNIAKYYADEWTSEAYPTTRKGYVMERYANVKKPLIVDDYDGISKQLGIPTQKETGLLTGEYTKKYKDIISQKAQAQGYDSIVIKNFDENGKRIDEVVIFDPKNISKTPIKTRSNTDPYAEEARATTGTTNPNDFITRFDGGVSARELNVPRMGIVGKDNYSDFVTKGDTKLQKELGDGVVVDAGMAYKKSNKPKTIDQQEGEVQLAGAVIGEEGNSFKKIFSKYIGQRDVASTRAAQESIPFAKIGKDKFEEFVNFREGIADKASPEVRKAVSKFSTQSDKYYKEAQKAGIDLNYVKNYITHLWEQPVEEVAQIYQDFKRANPNFKFAKERTLPTYAEGISMGLKPKFSNVGEVLNEYVKRLEMSKANLELFKDMRKQGLLVDAGVGRNTPGFVPITAPGFPKSVININNKTVEGFYYAPDSIARQLNQLFSPQADTGLVGKAANIGARVSGKIQDITLSGGLPRTPINAFSIAQAQKEILSGRISSPIVSMFKSLTTGSANKYFAENVEQIKKMQARNIPMSTSYQVDNFVPKGVIEKVFGKSIGEAWNKTISEPTFQRFLPMLQVRLFNDIESSALKSGKSAEEAADIAANAVKNFYGVIGSDTQATRTQIGKDASAALLFAPRFRESMINFWVNNLKAVDPRKLGDRALDTNRKFIVGAIITYGVMDALNRQFSGKGLHENPQGKEDKLLIPLDDGFTLGIPYLSSIATVPRGIYRIGKAAAQGNISQASKDAFQTFASSGLKPIGDVIANQDYFGSQIYDPYGTSADKFKSIGKYVGGQVVPTTIREGYKGVAGKQPGYQTASKALELPFRFYKSESIANAPFWEKYNEVKKVGEKLKDLQIKKDPSVNDFVTKNASALQEYENMKLAVNAYYQDNKNSKFIQEYRPGTATIGKDVAIVDGEIVDLSFQPQAPKLTGIKEIDSKKISKYRGEITSKENDIIKLMDAGIISQDQAETELKKLSAVRDSLKAPAKAKKVTIKPVKVAKFRFLNPGKSLSLKPLPKLNLSTYKPKNIRLAQSEPSYKIDKSKFNPRFS